MSGDWSDDLRERLRRIERAHREARIVDVVVWLVASPVLLWRVFRRATQR